MMPPPPALVARSIPKLHQTMLCLFACLFIFSSCATNPTNFLLLCDQPNEKSGAASIPKLTKRCSCVLLVYLFSPPSCATNLNEKSGAARDRQASGGDRAEGGRQVRFPRRHRQGKRPGETRPQEIEKVASYNPSDKMIVVERLFLCDGGVVVWWQVVSNRRFLFFCAAWYVVVYAFYKCACFGKWWGLGSSTSGVCVERGAFAMAYRAPAPEWNTACLVARGTRNPVCCRRPRGPQGGDKLSRQAHSAV